MFTNYEQLNTETAIDYIKQISTLDVADVNFECEEIGDGNLNFVYLLKNTDEPAQCYIIKQAVPYCRVLGEGSPLAKERMSFEIRSLLKFTELVPQHVPEIFHTDEEMSIIIMQYLGDHQILRDLLINGQHLPNIAIHLAEFLAISLFKTSSFSLDSKSKRALASQFIENTDLCKLTEDYIFTIPYLEEGQYLSDEIKEKVLTLKNIFMNKTDALLHGDLHTGSVFANTDETYIIDSEFSFVGPFGFDIGLVIANFAMCLIRHQTTSEHIDYQSWLLDQIILFWGHFEKVFLSLWEQEPPIGALNETAFLSGEALNKYRRDFVQNIFHEAIGFAGCEMLRRQLCVATVKDITSIEEEALREAAKQNVILTGSKFVLFHEEINTINDVAQLLSGRDLPPSVHSIKKAIVDIAQQQCSQGMNVATDGNISYRISDDQILITDSGKRKGHLTEEDIATINIHGDVISGRPSSEKLMHLTIYESCPNAKVVIHAHPPTAISWSLISNRESFFDVRALSEMCITISPEEGPVGCIPIVDYARPGTQDLGTSLLDFLPQHRTLILSNHGAISWGETLEEATNAMERLEHSAKIMRDARLLGDVQPLPQEEVDLLGTLLK